MTDTFETREQFSKSQFTKQQVEAEAARRRNDPGVTSTRVEDGGADWILVTVRTVIR